MPGCVVNSQTDELFESPIDDNYLAAVLCEMDGMRSIVMETLVPSTFSQEGLRAALV